jgi:hypothetical protein
MFVHLILPLYVLLLLYDMWRLIGQEGMSLLLIGQSLYSLFGW